MLSAPPWKLPALMELCEQVTLPWSDAGAREVRKTPLSSAAWLSLVPCSWAQHDYTACAQPGHSEDQRAAWGMRMPNTPLSHPLFFRAAPKSEIPLALLWFMFTGHKAVLDPTWHPVLHQGSLGLSTAPPVPQAVGEQSPLSHAPQASCARIGKVAGLEPAQVTDRPGLRAELPQCPHCLPSTPGLQCPLPGLD